MSTADPPRPAPDDRPEEVAADPERAAAIDEAEATDDSVDVTPAYDYDPPPRTPDAPEPHGS